MDIFFYILTPILIDIAICFFVPYVFSQSKKEKLEDSFIYKTHAPKRSLILSLLLLIIISVVFTTGTIVIIVFHWFDEIQQWIAYSFSVLFLWTIFILLFFCVAVPYESIHDDSIVVFRWFRKRKKPFAMMKGYKYSFNQLIVYGKDDKVLFFVADNRVGIKSIINSLEEHCVLRNEN